MTGYPQQKNGKHQVRLLALLRADSWFTGCFFSGTDNFSEYLARQFTMAAVFYGTALPPMRIWRQLCNFL